MASSWDTRAAYSTPLASPLGSFGRPIFGFILLNLNPIILIEKWISEHGSASVLRDHLALVKEQKSNLEAENAILKAALDQCKAEKEALETKISELQINLKDAQKQLAVFESVRKELKEQMELEAKIRQLEAMNNDLELQLRIKSIGF